MKYDKNIVTAYYKSQGLPEPAYELQFHPVRRWRFDLAFEQAKVYLEVNGGIWVAGRHSRGAGVKKDWEKWNTATTMGWRGLWCEPRDLCTMDMVKFIKEAING